MARKPKSIPDESQTPQAGTAPQDEGQTPQAGTAPQDEGQTAQAGTTSQDEGQTAPAGTTSQDEGQTAPAGTTSQDEGQTAPAGTTSQDEGQANQVGTKLQEEGQGQKQNPTVNAHKGLNLREGPHKDYRRLTVLENGMEVEILPLPGGIKVPGWSLVTTPEYTGWVADAFLRIPEET